MVFASRTDDDDKVLRRHASRIASHRTGVRAGGLVGGWVVGGLAWCRRAQCLSAIPDVRARALTVTGAVRFT